MEVLIGKSPINGSFSIAMFDYERVLVRWFFHVIPVLVRWYLFAGTSSEGWVKPLLVDGILSKGDSKTPKSWLLFFHHDGGASQSQLEGFCDLQTNSTYFFKFQIMIT